MFFAEKLCAYPVADAPSQTINVCAGVANSQCPPASFNIFASVNGDTSRNLVVTADISNNTISLQPLAPELAGI